MLSAPLLRPASPASSAPLQMRAAHMRSAGGRRVVTVLERNSLDFIFLLTRNDSHGLPPPSAATPPAPPPPREPPMLEAPRDLTGSSSASAHAAAGSTKCAAVVRTWTIWDLLVTHAVAATASAHVACAPTAVAHVPRTRARTTSRTSLTIACAAAIARTSRVPVSEVTGLLLTAYVLPGVCLPILPSSRRGSYRRTCWRVPLSP